MRRRISCALGGSNSIEMIVSVTLGSLREAGGPGAPKDLQAALGGDTRLRLAW
jgi:hypothetical protein